MFGTLYEPPTLTFSGLFLLFAINIAAIFFYKQAATYYRNQQLYYQHRGPVPEKIGMPTPPGPAGAAPGTR
jgi:hypothetical protein